MEYYGRIIFHLIYMQITFADEYSVLKDSVGIVEILPGLKPRTNYLSSSRTHIIYNQMRKLNTNIFVKLLFNISLYRRA